MDIISQYGLAGIDRTDTDHQKVVSILKKDKGTQWAKEHGFGGVFLGIRKDESVGRRWNLTVRTPLYQVNGFWHCCPLADWTYRDVFAYLISNNIQYPAFYDFEDMGMTREWIRNSSWVSTDGAAKGQIAWLRKHYPKQYKELSARFPEVKGYV
jgi:3'-phosphoadenosine 5'-phosphosulfate sulfotransferase (PAPS reductase)/FAD synthetase